MENLLELLDDIRLHVDDHDPKSKVLSADDPNSRIMGWICDSCEEGWKISLRDVKMSMSTSDDMEMLMKTAICRQYLASALSTNDASMLRDPNEITFGETHDLSEITDEQRAAMDRILARSLDFAKTRRVVEG